MACNYSGGPTVDTGALTVKVAGACQRSPGALGQSVASDSGRPSANAHGDQGPTAARPAGLGRAASLQPGDHLGHHR